MKIFVRGNTIIEILIAATIISVAVLAAIALATRSQKQTDFSRDLNRATEYNTESIDWLRNMRQVMGWPSFVVELQSDAGAGSSVSYCLDTLPDNGEGFSALPPSGTCSSTIGTTPFMRQMNITWSGSPPTAIEVEVVTSWEGGARSATSETELYRW